MSAADGKRRYICSSCGALACGVPIFRGMVGDEHGRRLWAAAAGAAGEQHTGPCAFCSIEMKPAPAERGRTWICVNCEMVWLDKEALAGLETPATASEVPAEETVTRCENCGAPLVHTWDEKCEYCGAALGAPEKVVVIETDAGDAPSHESGWRKAGELIGGIVEGMRGPHAL